MLCKIYQASLCRNYCSEESFAQKVKQALSVSIKGERFHCFPVQILSSKSFRQKFV